MKNVRRLVLCCLILAICSCETTGSYFNRPKIKPAINNQCSGYLNGELIDTTNYISVSPEDYDIIQDYYLDKEDRLYKCLKFNRCK